MSTLYLVPTPIGNLKDITLRAIETLFSVDLIACEDTRRTGLLLQNLIKDPSGFYCNHLNNYSKIDKHPPLLSFNDHNEAQRIPYLINLLKSGKSLALVSDSGTPLISDPGFKLVRSAIVNNIQIESLPGPSAVLTALTSSGFTTNQFAFLAYPPAKGGKRESFFQLTKALSQDLRFTTIILEAPHRLQRTLTDLRRVCGNIPIATCRELTKIHEEVRRENLDSAIKHYSETESKGEFTIVV